MKLIAALIAIVLLACACAGDPPPPTPTPTHTATPAPTLTATPIPTATPEPAPTAEPTITPTPTFAPPTIILPGLAPDLATATPAPEFPTDLERELDVIELQTAAIRGLSPTKPVERRLVSADELRGIIEDEFAEEADELALEGQLYALLGIIESDASLSDLLIDVYSDIVVGLYDSDEELLVVLADPEAFGPAEELTVAHEVTHSLQQMHYDIDGMLDAAEGNADREAAITALIEGDASITETLYDFITFTEKQSQQAAEAYAQVDNSAFLAAPEFIRQTLVFPYTYGRNFAIDLYLLNNDLSAIDAAYANPPQSTEQIIHFELYGSDAPGAAPVAVELPPSDSWAAALGASGGEWRELDRDVMGESFFLAMLAGGPSAAASTADAAAAGWGGDAYALLEGPDSRHALASLSVWDTPEDAVEFGEAIRAYLAVNGAFADVFYRVAVDEAASTVRLAVLPEDAPDVTETLDAIVAALAP